MHLSNLLMKYNSINIPIDFLFLLVLAPKLWAKLFDHVFFLSSVQNITLNLKQSAIEAKQAFKEHEHAWLINELKY